MKKLLAATVFAMLICGGSFAGSLDIGTHASFYAPIEGGGNTLMAGIDATYTLNSYFSARADVDASNYQTEFHKYSLNSVAVTLLVHALGSSRIDPYAGAGIGLFEKKVDNEIGDTTGLNALVGIAFHFPTFDIGIETCYVIPDTRDMGTGFYSAGANFTGGMHVNL